MATEIERKFLVKSDGWRDSATQGVRFHQGYLIGSDQASVRVRIEGDCANINIKSATIGICRSEYEYPIPLNEAKEMLEQLCAKPQIVKTRYIINDNNHKWEVDEFEGDNHGLIIAEIELAHKDEAFNSPSWLGDEVSDDPRYYNHCLAKHPYKDW